MKKTIIFIWVALNIIRSFPAIITYYLSPSKEIIDKDIIRWVDVILKDSTKKPIWKYLHFLLLNFPEFRNIFYYRIAKTNFILGRVIQPFYPRLKSLYISTEHIGSGLVIQHGFSTIIHAKSIGENCTISQQVTIGKATNGNPIIEDGVQITASAVVIGGIRIGSNSIVGANATVTKDVPENSVVVGNPAYIIKKNGMKIKKAL
ncbi:UNVERIFIED_CONTAM: serine acetyltransferase [Bacillus cereus]